MACRGGPVSQSVPDLSAVMKSPAALLLTLALAGIALQFVRVTLISTHIKKTK